MIEITIENGYIQVILAQTFNRLQFQMRFFDIHYFPS